MYTTGCFLYFFVWAAYQEIPGNIGDRYKAFTEQQALGLFVALTLVTATLLALEELNPRVLLSESQKERIRILEGFGPDSETVEFFSNRSIYDAIITSLSRLDTKIGTPRGSPRAYRICLLLCSPALDYKGNANSSGKWGAEFWTLFKRIADHTSTKADVCYLPVQQQGGFNPMDDFLWVLAHSIGENPKIEFDQLKLRTEEIHENMERVQTQDPESLVLRTHMRNTPFQMVLINGSDMKEVVLSFAGREILESGAGNETKGFFSSDPYVVETFQRIYDVYSRKHSRLSYVPVLTSSVVERHRTQAAHRILDYLGLGIDLEVAPGAFSPAIGNSTKFTAWVLNKILGPSQTEILDIGSGSGVLARVAEETLLGLGVTPKRILAAEANEDCFASLQANCSAHAVIPKCWRLESTPSGGVRLGSAKSAIADEEIGEFDVIIGDLPFLDVDVADLSAKDERFFDPKHQAHSLLLKAVSSTTWLRKNGVLITAFSSLGGLDDVNHFEGMIANNRLQIIQRFDFHESNVLWIVFVIMRQGEFDLNDYWWNKLKARSLAT